MDRKDKVRELKPDAAGGISRAKKNVEDLHAIEEALRANLEKLRALKKREAQSQAEQRG